MAKQEETWGWVDRAFKWGVSRTCSGIPKVEIQKPLGLPCLQKRALKFFAEILFTIEISNGKGLGKSRGRVFYLAQESIRNVVAISEQVQNKSETSFHIFISFDRTVM